MIFIIIHVLYKLYLLLWVIQFIDLKFKMNSKMLILLTNIVLIRKTNYIYYINNLQKCIFIFNKSKINLNDQYIVHSWFFLKLTTILLWKCY